MSKANSTDTETVTFPPGTVFPVGGRPHLGTMCGYRTGVRRNFRSVTVLCYESGVYQFRLRDGRLYSVQCADGLVPIRACEKHMENYLSRFDAGVLTPEKVEG